jgi:hypothetical protein
MHPLKKLKKLLQDRPTPSGRVVGAEGNYVTVATPHGSQRIQRSSGDVTPYRIGDEVVLANGQVIGRRINQPKTYVV